MPLKPRIDTAALAQLFSEAHTPGGWLPDPVPPELLRELHALASWPPTAMNCQPRRLVFITTPAAKERLIRCLSPGNVAKTRAAPVTAIVAYDTQFHEFFPEIWHGVGARESFAANPSGTAASARLNGTLGAAYVILAARALGLDCGPMGGFAADKVDAEFFPDGRWKSNILCNLGVADPARQHPRNPRLSFEQACQVL